MAYEKKLNEKQWGDIYNIEKIGKELIIAVKNENYNLMAKEMFKLAKPGNKILEIGSGSGETSLCLAARFGCNVTLLDYSKDALGLAEYVANELSIPINTICTDATKKLPFNNNEFDIVFHAGLLEHFEPHERTGLLKSWKPFGKKHISMVPNAASLCYRIGKEIQENNGTWQWGRELPAYTQIKEFMLAGFEVEDEYTAGEFESIEWFLNKDNPLRQPMIDFWKNRRKEDKTDIFNQGYLLITIGNNNS